MLLRAPSFLAATKPVSGGGAYQAGAVHFDDASFLRIASLTASDSSYLTFALFFRTTADDPADHGLPLMDFYPAGEEDTVSFSGPSSFSMTFNAGGGDQFAVSADFGDPVYDGNWHSLVVSFDIAHPAGSKLWAAYLDRSLLSPLAGQGTADSFAFAFSGASLGVPDTTEDYATLPPVDLAVYQVFVGTKIVQGDNTIADADLNRFVTAGNKPVNPATAAAGYGTPTILFDGNASTFATNQGTGGAFTLTGSLTNASSSPSD